MTFAYPWLLFSPALFFLMALIPRRSDQHARFPSYAILRPLPRSLRQIVRRPLLFLLSAVTAVLLGIAAARPQHITVIKQPLNARNIFLVIDVSRSMSARDFATGFGHSSRMEGIKTVVAEYVRDRTQDRVGLVVFGNTAYLQSPLTADTSLVEELVQGLRPGMAGDGTAIGDGLGLALKRLKEFTEGSKAIVLMTDGDNNAGQISPLKAAKVAKELGIRIHTVGIGSGEAPLGDQMFNGMLGVPIGPRANFDESTLKQIAETTGGVYFNADNLDGLKQVYHEIEKLTETEKEQPAQTIIDELFVPYLLAACVCYLLALALSSTVFLKVP